MMAAATTLLSSCCSLYPRHKTQINKCWQRSLEGRGMGRGQAHNVTHVRSRPAVVVSESWQVVTGIPKSGDTTFLRQEYGIWALITISGVFGVIWVLGNDIIQRDVLEPSMIASMYCVSLFSRQSTGPISLITGKVEEGSRQIYTQALCQVEVNCVAVTLFQGTGYVCNIQQWSGGGICAVATWTVLKQCLLLRRTCLSVAA